MKEPDPGETGGRTTRPGFPLPCAVNSRVESSPLAGLRGDGAGDRGPASIQSENRKGQRAHGDLAGVGEDRAGRSVFGQMKCGRRFRGISPRSLTISILSSRQRGRRRANRKGKPARPRPRFPAGRPERAGGSAAPPPPQAAVTRPQEQGVEIRLRQVAHRFRRRAGEAFRTWPSKRKPRTFLLSDWWRCESRPRR